MPRKARVASVSGYMHIIVRGIGKQLLFEEEKDYRYYLNKLSKYCVETSVRVMAFCLMDNHVHLLVHGDADSVALLMKKMGVSYSYYYNHKYNRVGHLFQDRYLSEAVDDERHFLTVLRYIVLNPQKAGICHASKYPWSSYNIYEECPEFMEMSMLNNLIGTREHYEAFIETPNDDQCLEYEVKKHDDEWALEIIRGDLGLKSGTELQGYDKKSRDAVLRKMHEKGMSLRQIARTTGISKNVIHKAIIG